MELALSTWPEIEEYLKSSKCVILPIGSTEQHGPTGCIGTDAICADGVARAIGEETGTLVAPVIAVGMSVHHTAFPGTMTLRPSTLIQVIVDCVTSLARHGFERFFLLNGHGGNDSPIKDAIWEIYSLLPDMNITNGGAIRMKQHNWYWPQSVMDLCSQLFPEQEGCHATPGEISLAMKVCAGAVRHMGEELPPTEDTRATDYGPGDFRASFPDGRIRSNPALASPENGQKILDIAVEEGASLLRQFTAED